MQLCSPVFLYVERSYFRAGSSVTFDDNFLVTFMFSPGACVLGVCRKVLTHKCYPPGSKAAKLQHREICTALYPKVLPPKYVTVIPTSNMYHEHALANFKFWYQEKTPLKKQCCKLPKYITHTAVIEQWFLSYAFDFSASYSYHMHVVLATSMTSVRLSVTLVDCDHMVQQKCQSAQDRIGRCCG